MPPVNRPQRSPRPSPPPNAAEACTQFSCMPMATRDTEKMASAQLYLLSKQLSMLFAIEDCWMIPISSDENGCPNVRFCFSWMGTDGIRCIQDPPNTRQETEPMKRRLVKPTNSLSFIDRLLMIRSIGPIVGSCVYRSSINNVDIQSGIWQGFFRLLQKKTDHRMPTYGIIQ